MLSLSNDSLSSYLNFLVSSKILLQACHADYLFSRTIKCPYLVSNHNKSLLSAISWSLISVVCQTKYAWSQASWLLIVNLFLLAACMTWDLAESGKQFITTVINGSDLVPTFSTASIDELRSEVLPWMWIEPKFDFSVNMHMVSIFCSVINIQVYYG